MKTWKSKMVASCDVIYVIMDAMETNKTTRGYA